MHSLYRLLGHQAGKLYEHCGSEAYSCHHCSDLDSAFTLQTSPLTALPEEVFHLLIKQLKSRDIGALRLTCKDLLKLVSEQTVHIHTKRNITRKRAASLQCSFPNVVSLSYHQADETTHHLAYLTKLTGLTLSVAIPFSYPEDEHFQSE